MDIGTRGGKSFESGYCNLNPRHRGAHEYIGEAYLIKDDLKSAQKHLAALREICSLPCEELTDLEREIASYIKKSADRSR